MKLNFTINKIDDSQAALDDGNGKIINWPRELLPLNVKKGEKITFNIGEEDNLAKDILNEILEDK